ncbi:MAG: FIST C-terminal domain-containing protein [Zetaproteobacteria bacterium]|nr:FIST C-terminal domain-containing protein [Zetaproteobacteria bacterium]
MGALTVKRGVSYLQDSQAAVAEIRDQILQDNMKLVIFFCASTYDLITMGAAIKTAFNCPVIGCTTSGEITPDGFSKQSCTAASIASDKVAAQVHLLPDINQFDVSKAERFVEVLHHQMAFSKEFDEHAMFGLVFIDGLSMAEERAVALLNYHLGGVQMVGGSAGDDLQFEKTFVYADGEFVSNAGVFALVECQHRFHIFKTQHFEPSDKKLVITGADTSQRQVFEINGLPAGEEYANMLGFDPKNLTPQIFSGYPLMLNVGGSWFVRSIQQCNSDGSLTFFCAIDEGLVLTLAQSQEMLTELRNDLQRVADQFDTLKLMIGCDCILRRLEVEERGLSDEMGMLMNAYHVLGFHTYGEQLNALHINQTFTAVAIGE